MSTFVTSSGTTISSNGMSSQLRKLPELAKKSSSVADEVKKLLENAEAEIQNPYRFFDFAHWPRCTNATSAENSENSTSTTCPCLLQWKCGKRSASAAASSSSSGGKKRQRKSKSNNNVEKGTNKTSLVPHPWIHRPEKCTECKCDDNPHCLVSLGIFPDLNNDSSLSISDDAVEEDAPKVKRSNWYDDAFEFRKILWIEQDTVQNHLETMVIPYQQSSNNQMLNKAQTKNLIQEQLVRIESFHRSLVAEKAVPPKPSDKQDSAMIVVTTPPGINNLGATCYLNSQLQCLALNPVFRDGVFSWKRPSSSNSATSSNSSSMSDVMSNLQKLLAGMHSGSKRVVFAEQLAQSLGLVEDEMQDPNEFAGLLFNRMQDLFQHECKTSNHNNLKDLLPSIFQGQYEYVTECQFCEVRSTRLESFTELTLPIIPATSSGDATDVEACLYEYLSSEELTGDNQYMCAHCGEKHDAKRYIQLAEVPPVINVQLSRYVYDTKLLMKRKTMDKVRLPRVLTVPTRVEGRINGADSDTASSKRPRTTKKASSNAKEYLLCGVLKHQGTSAYNGHYVAEAMDWTTGLWFEFNDEDVMFLESGPKHSFWKEDILTCGERGSAFDDIAVVDSLGKVGQRDVAAPTVTGSTDAYSLFYAERSFLANRAAQEIQKENSQLNDDLLLWIDKEKKNHEHLVEE